MADFISMHRAVGAETEAIIVNLDRVLFVAPRLGTKQQEVLGSWVHEAKSQETAIAVTETVDQIMAYVVVLNHPRTP